MKLLTGFLFLLVRSKSIFDGALPSANAIALSNLRRLSQLSDRPEQRKKYAFRAEKLIAGFAASINQHPSMLLAIEVAK